MAPLTRRRALHGVAGLLAGLAGCPERSGGDDGPTPTEPAERPDPDDETVETDPDHVVLRQSDRAPDEPVAWFADGSLETPGTTVSPGAGQHRGLIASEATARAVPDACAEIVAALDAA